jgi:hypothetical protein
MWKLGWQTKIPRKKIYLPIRKPMETKYNTLEDFLIMLEKQALKYYEQNLIGNALLTNLSWKYNLPTSNAFPIKVEVALTFILKDNANE